MVSVHSSRNNRIVLPYAPEEWQREVADCETMHRVVVAGRHSGKSWIGSREVLKSQDIETRKFNVSHMTSQSIKQIVDAMWKPFTELTKQIGVPNKGDRIVELTKGRFRGGEVKFRSVADAIRGQRSDMVMIDEGQLCSQYQMENSVFPLIRSQDRFAVDEGRILILGTVKDKQLLYEYYLKGQDPDNKDWMSWTFTPYDMGWSQEKIDSIRRTVSDEVWEREYMCNWEMGADHQVYAGVLTELDRKKRFVTGLYNSELPVVAALDLGHTAPTGIWYAQFPYRDLSRVNLVRYEEYRGQFQEDIIDSMKRHPFEYSHILLPHDAKGSRGRMYTAQRKDIPTLYRDSWEESQVTIVSRCTNPKSDLNLTRDFLYSCYFDKVECEQGLRYLRNYHTFRKDDVVTDEIPKQKNRDCADAFRTLSMGIQQYMAAEKLRCHMLYGDEWERSDEEAIRQLFPPTTTDPFDSNRYRGIVFPS